MTAAEAMGTIEEQEQELKRYCDEVSSGEETGVKYYLLKNLRLPSKCSPASCDALLCPTAHSSGYPSRLFFAQPVSGPFGRNWNFSGRILASNWVAFSFTVAPAGLSLDEILKCHLTGLVQAT